MAFEKATQTVSYCIDSYTLHTDAANVSSDDGDDDEDDDEDEDDDDDQCGVFAPEVSKERLKSKRGGGTGGGAGASKKSAGGGADKKKPDPKKKRGREEDGEQSPKASSSTPSVKAALKKHAVINPAGAGTDAGDVEVDIRGPLDDRGWGKRSCTIEKCKKLDYDPTSPTYTDGVACGGICRRSYAYLYCVSNNLQYHKFPDGKFYDPEKLV